MLDSHSFGSWLKHQRSRRHITQAALGELVGCATITIKKIEREERRPSAQMARRLAECLGVPQHDWDAFVRAARSGQAPEHLEQYPAHSVLPAPRNAFIGRDKEQARLIELLGSSGARLVTLVGPPGVGKTRLALQAAWRMRTDFLDGIYWLDLALLTNAQDIAITACQVVGLAESRLEPLEQWIGWLGRRKTLFILDNCEQLDAPEGVISQLLDRAAGLKLLLTSRIPLDVYGERLFPLAPLPVGAVPVDPVDLGENPALALFQARVREVLPDFALNPENIHLVTTICRELDGLPLAIELAARQLNHSSLADIGRRVDQRLELLKQGPLDWQPRHQTFRAAIEWSVALLSPQEQRDFARLGVFSGGFSGEAAHELTSEASFRNLLQASLVQRRNEDHFALLQTVRDYALENLHAMKDSPEAYRAHASFFCELAAQARADYHSAAVAEWQERLALEQNNVRAALTWCQQGDPELGLELAANMWRMWYLWGQYRSGVGWLHRFLELTRESTPTRARALRGAGVLVTRFGEFEQAEALFRDSLLVARQLQDSYQIASALMGLGDCHHAVGDYDRSGPYFERALQLFDATGDALHTSWALGGLAEVAYYRDRDLSKALELMGESVRLARQADAPRHLGWILGISADMHTVAGGRDRAVEMLNGAYRHFDAVGDAPGKSYALLRLGALSIHANRLQKARLQLEGALQFARDTLSYEAQALCLLGLIELTQERYERGVRLYTEALGKHHLMRQKLNPADLDLLDEMLAKAKDALGVERFNALVAELQD